MTKKEYAKNFPVSWTQDIEDLAKKISVRLGFSNKSAYLRKRVFDDAKKLGLIK